MAGKFEVYIEENSQFDDASGRLKVGEFTNSGDALVFCRKVVDEFLTINYKKGTTAEELFQNYALFGEDAFIVGDAPSENFSAWDYARERCREICGEDSNKEDFEGN